MPDVFVAVVSPRRADVDLTLASLARQPGVTCDAVVVDAVSSLQANVARVDAPFLLQIDAGDELVAGALRRLVDRAAAQPDAGVVQGLVFETREGRLTRTAFRKQTSFTRTVRLYRTSVLRDAGALGDDLVARIANRHDVVFARDFISATRRSAGGTPAVAIARPSAREFQRPRRIARALYDLFARFFGGWSWSLSTRVRKREPPRIVYYTWHFPILSQTFGHRELGALLAAGVDVQVIADGRGQIAGLDQDAEQLRPRTRYLDDIPRANRRAAVRRLVVHHPLRTTGVALYLLSHRFGQRKAPREDFVLFTQALRLAAVLDECKATHVHAPWADRTALTAMLAARLLRLPYSLQARAHDIHRASYQYGLSDKLARAETVVTNTSYNRDALERLLPDANRPRLVTIYNGIGLDEFDPPPGRIRRSGEPMRLLSVARLIEQKGLDDLLRACRWLDDRGCHFHCDIVGAAELPLYAAYAVRLMELFAELDLADRVTFHGAEPFARVKDRYRAADIFVLPCVIAGDGSRDITPNAVIEAMAMALPVVSTTITGLPEIVEDGVSGVLISPRDPAALAAAIETLMSDPERRARLGRAARSRVEDRFDARRNAGTRAALFHTRRAGSSASAGAP